MGKMFVTHALLLSILIDKSFLISIESVILLMRKT